MRLKPSAAFLAVTALLASHLAVSGEISPTALSPVEVVSSKIAAPLDSSPAMITVISGKELADRNVRDLRTALSLVAGVDIAPGGDGGPASAVPGLWGLREFDAFLLVVDGVPSGGAFNPALTTLDLTNIKQIEVLRGAAPVMYGATSFVGVINVIHYPAGEMVDQASVGLGSRNTVSLGLSRNLSTTGPFKQSLNFDASTQQFSQDASKLNRAHVLYRAAADLSIGKVHFDLDATMLRQRPYSPHPVEDSALSRRFPLDANANPLDAKADENRVQFNLGIDKDLTYGKWVTLLSLAHADNRNIRGFLRPDFADDGVTHNADGYRQSVAKDYGYFDTYLITNPTSTLSLTTGFDFLFGNGHQSSDNFEYGVMPNGSNRPASIQLPIDESTKLRDKRNFAGAYTQVDWRPSERWNLLVGLRYNDTRESRSGEAVDHHADPGTPHFTASSHARKTGFSGTAAGSYALWISDASRLTAFANYRNTYKPAAIDFGPEAEGTILKPETAKSWEAGLRGRAFAGRFDWELSYFRMNFRNLVIRENLNGLPSLANAGQEKFSGVEAEGRYRVSDALQIKATAAHHNAKYSDYSVAQEDGSLLQFSGNRLEVSPEYLAAVGVIYAPLKSWGGSLVWNWVGKRFLDRENTVLAGSYATLDAGVNYRFSTWELCVDAYNISNRRDPVAVSELGEGQLYRLPGRTVLVSAKMNF